MEVVALRPGFYDGTLRNAGETFDVPEGTKAAWFGPADGPANKAKPAKASKQPTTLSEAGKDSSKSFVEANKPLA